MSPRNNSVNFLYTLNNGRTAETSMERTTAILVELHGLFCV
jgi:hypothetical protein